MTSDADKDAGKGAGMVPQRNNVKGLNPGEQAKPDWAIGLRRLYDSVVEEPLPSCFEDLLAKLDSKS